MRIDEMVRIWRTCCTLSGGPPGIGNRLKSTDRRRSTQRPHTPKTCAKSSHRACFNEENEAEGVVALERETGQSDRLKRNSYRNFQQKTRSLYSFGVDPIGRLLEGKDRRGQNERGKLAVTSARHLHPDQTMVVGEPVSLTQLLCGESR